MPDSQLQAYPALKKLWELAGNTNQYNKALEQILHNFELVSLALGAEPLQNKANELAAEFATMIEKDFRAFCDLERGINDVAPTLELLKLRDEFKRIANFPKLFSKRVGAIGGGFSSGKSAFLNSFLRGKGVRLAEGIRPVTAIPSFVIHDAESRIQGISANGGVFQIPAEIYKTISHDMLKTLNFNLRDLVSYITVQAPLPEDMFSDLCLMDTPGYNPPGIGSREHDEAIARNYISRAEFLIWMIGVDSNGSITREDIDFLSGLPFGKERKLYIVANKADLKPDDEINAILDEFMECAKDAELNVEGVCAYTSRGRQHVLATRGMDIHEFLKENNRSTERYQIYEETLHNVFKGYFEFIARDCRKNKLIRDQIQKTWLAAMGSNAFDVTSPDASLEESLNRLWREFAPNKAESEHNRMTRARDLRDRFMSRMKDFCSAAGIERKIGVTCPNCGKIRSAKECFCANCGFQFKNLASRQAARIIDKAGSLGNDFIDSLNTGIKSFWKKFKIQ